MKPLGFLRRKRRRFGSTHMGELWRRASLHAAEDREIKQQIEAKIAQRFSDMEKSEREQGHGGPATL